MSTGMIQQIEENWELLKLYLSRLAGMGTGKQAQRLALFRSRNSSLKGTGLGDSIRWSAPQCFYLFVCNEMRNYIKTKDILKIWGAWNSYWGVWKSEQDWEVSYDCWTELRAHLRCEIMSLWAVSWLSAFPHSHSATERSEHIEETKSWI